MEKAKRGAAARSGKGQARTKTSKAKAAAVETAPPRTSIDVRTGAALRRGRLERGLKLSDVAAVADISVALLSRIENGQSAVSLVLLERLCASLGIDIASLIGEVQQAKGTAQLLKAADQMEVVRAGTKHGHTYRLLSYHRGPQRTFEPFFIKMNRKSAAYLRFQHPGTEFIYMLKGRMAYRFGDKTFIVEPGDAFTFSGSVMHGPEKILDDQVQFLSIIVYGD